MTGAFDKRIVRVGIEIFGEIYVFEDLEIVANGTKYASALMNPCNVRISNLTREQRRDILTKASPVQRLGRAPINMTLDVGRESTGVFRLYEGSVYQGGATQPPDIGITLNSLTNNFSLSMTSALSFDSRVDVRSIAQQTATNNGLQLEYNASPKLIENYSVNGSLIEQVKSLNNFGGVVAYVDNRTLVVHDSDKPRGNLVRVINKDTGMVGVPQPSQSGVVVQVMIDNTIQIGQQVQIESQINPGANGDYIVRTMDFDIANRDGPFWYTLNCVTPTFYTGGTL